MKHHGRLASFLLAICLICSLWTVTARAATKTVRLGYYSYGDFMSFNAAGEHTGYSIEYLQEIAKYTGWTYEMVDCHSWENAQAMLASGEIDLLPAVYHSEDRADRYLFPTLPMCSTYTTLNTRPADNRFYYEDFPAFNGMRVGVITGSRDAENFAQFCLDNQITAETIPYATTDTALFALNSGYLDALAITYLGRSLTFRSIAQFAPADLYVAAANSRPDLLDELNSAQNTLTLQNPDYTARLYSKYFSISPTQRPVFTRSEADYIQSCGEITAVYDASWFPLEYTDPDSGEYAGIVADLFALIEEESGLRFRFVPAADYQEALALSQRDSIDLLCAMTSDYLSDQKAGLTATQYFLRVPTVLVSGKDITKALSRYGALNGYYTYANNLENGTNGSLTFYDTPDECFEALRGGDVDGIYINRYTADYMLSKSRYSDFSVTTLTNVVKEISIGLSASADPRLFSILDKCIHFTASEQMDRIIIKNSSFPVDISWDEVFRQHPLSIIGGIASVLMVVILLLSALLVLKSRSNKQIQGLLNLDTLTGIFNLNKFRAEAHKILENAGGKEYAIVYADIQQFKAINDTIGFAEGDAILCAMADMLRSSLAPGELCARVSADHFVLLLHTGGWAALQEHCAALDKGMNDWAARRQNGYVLVLAFGIYLVDEKEHGDISLMMDLANYARRSSSSVSHRSRAVLYDAAMRQEVLRQRELSDRMQAALDAGEFIPYFQPKVDMCTGNLVGSEALVRWNYPGKGIILPGQFVPYFEKNGFVLELDLYIYEQVCRAIRTWMSEGREITPVSCNFSRLHVSDELFPEKLMEIADRYGVPHRYLELEVTESIFMRDIERFTRQFDRLKALGFPISIDDFGSGYSSLGFLQRFAVDVIKLDRSFIQEGMRSKREQIVLRGVVSLARNLGVDVICEGVETSDQADILQKLGCRTAQGFYYAKPMPLADFEAFTVRKIAK